MPLPSEIRMQNSDWLNMAYVQSQPNQELRVTIVGIPKCVNKFEKDMVEVALNIGKNWSIGSVPVLDELENTLGPTENWGGASFTVYVDHRIKFGNDYTSGLRIRPGSVIPGPAAAPVQPRGVTPRAESMPKAWCDRIMQVCEADGYSLACLSDELVSRGVIQPDQPLSEWPSGQYNAIKEAMEALKLKKEAEKANEGLRESEIPF